MRRASLIVVLCVSLTVVGVSVAAPLGARLSAARPRAARKTAPAHRVTSRGCSVAAPQRRAGVALVVLGARTTGPVLGASPAGVARAFSVRGRAVGLISSIQVYVAAGSRARRLMVALYSASGCRAGSRLAVGALHRPKPGAWNAVRVSPTWIATGRSYSLVVLGSGGVFRFRRPRGPVCASAASRRGLSAPPFSWKAGIPGTGCGVSAYAVGASSSIVHGTLGTTFPTGVLTSTAGAGGGASVGTSAGSGGGAGGGPVGGVPNPPAATAVFTVSADPTIGQPVTFDGSGSSCVVGPCTYAWDDDGGEPPIGDWPLGTGQVLQYTFTGSAFTVYVRLTVTDALGQTGTVEHDVSVAPAALVNSVVPSVGGTAQVGDQLTANPGTWSGSPTYQYAWSDCNSGGTGCASIAGATDPSYTVVSGDVGQTIVVTVTASNAGGSASATSSPTAVVTSGSGGGGGGGSAASANLWVSTTGSSDCTRSGTPVTYAAAVSGGHVCNTWGVAYPIADCGDLVYIKGGTYANLPGGFDGSSKNGCSQPVVFSGAPGETVLTDSVGGTGSWWTLENITLGDTGSGIPAGLSMVSPASNVTIKNVTGGNLYMSGANDVTIEDNDFGPCYNLISLPAGQNNQNGYPGPTYSPDPTVTCNQNIKLDDDSNVTFKNNVIHDFLDDDSNSSYDHFECVFVDGGTNITFDSNEFYDCQIYSIFIQDFGGHGLNGLTIQNNWFWADQGLMGACTSDVSGCPAENAGGVHPNTIVFGGDGTNEKNILIRYNTFDAQDGVGDEGSPSLSSGANARMVGNLLGDASAQDGTTAYCIANMSYSYNVMRRPTAAAMSARAAPAIRPPARSRRCEPASTARRWMTCICGVARWRRTS